LVLTIPIIYPTIIALGFDPIWYSVLMVRIVEVGLITPPFGINLFGMAGTVNVPIRIMYRGVVPFLIADGFHIALLIAVPGLSTFLPNVMVGR
jgi:TRAP-type C4-dicarboxylate transport system permease large subunit